MSVLVSVVKEWMLVWVILYSTLHTCRTQRNSCSEPAGEEGAIRVTGVNSTYLIAGRLELCVEGVWRAVCHQRWGQNDADKVCQQLGFDPPRAGFCRNSCFGRSSSRHTITNITCGENDTRLINCLCIRNQGQNTLSDGDCVEYAGIICRNSTTVDILLSVVPQDSTSTSTSTNTSQASNKSGPALGSIAAVLAVILVGVVLGWVWHCHRNKSGAKFHEKDIRPVHNPSYTTPHLPTQNTFQDPRDTPLNISPAKTSFHTYDIICSPAQITPTPSIPTGDRIYHVLEDPREKDCRQDRNLKEKRKDRQGADLEKKGDKVPVAQKTSSKAAAGKQQGTEEYSTLQHH